VILPPFVFPALMYNKHDIEDDISTKRQTSQMGGQWYNDTYPFSIPWRFAVQQPKAFFLLSKEAMTSVDTVAVANTVANKIRLV
jgi:hypothetical protein